MTYDRCELAWAAGFFDGEGSFKLGDHKYAQATIDQVDPEVLYKFQASVGFGVVSGPYTKKNPAHLPQYRWAVYRFDLTQQVLILLWPWLGSVKRAQAIKILRQAVPGVSPTFCRRGHKKIPENRNKWGQCRLCIHGDHWKPKRKFKKIICRRGHRKIGENLTKWGQCRACLRIADKKRRH
jgi:hypothetical protein